MSESVAADLGLQGADRSYSKGNRKSNKLVTTRLILPDLVLKKLTCDRKEAELSKETIGRDTV